MTNEKIDDIEFKSKYSYHTHIGCGGNLTFEKREWINNMLKDLYRCDKCHDLVSCIFFPSWKDYHKVN